PAAPAVHPGLLAAAKVAGGRLFPAVLVRTQQTLGQLDDRVQISNAADWPPGGSSLRVGRTSTPPSRRPTACQASFASTSLTRWSRGGSPPAGRIRQVPSIRRWVWIVTPPSTWVSRCLPRGWVPETVRPVRSVVAYRGTRKSLRVSTRPARALSRWRAASQTVSPSG